MKRSFSRRALITLILLLLVSVFLMVYGTSRPRLAPGQAPLTDISKIEDLRTQFNRDMGQTRLIILVAPT